MERGLRQEARRHAIPIHRMEPDTIRNGDRPQFNHRLASNGLEFLDEVSSLSTSANRRLDLLRSSGRKRRCFVDSALKPTHTLSNLGRALHKPSGPMADQAIQPSAFFLEHITTEWYPKLGDMKLGAFSLRELGYAFWDSSRFRAQDARVDWHTNPRRRYFFGHAAWKTYAFRPTSEHRDGVYVTEANFHRLERKYGQRRFEWHWGC